MDEEKKIDDREVLQKIGKTMTGEPLAVTIHISPENSLHRFLQKIKLRPKKRVFPVTQTTMGNLVRISTIMVTMDLKSYKTMKEASTDYQTVIDNADKISEIVAIILNNKRSAPGKSDIRFIYENLSGPDLFTMLQTIFESMQIMAFTTSITSIKGMNILERKTASVNSVNGSGVSQ